MPTKTKKRWTKRQQAAHRRKWIKALRSGKYEQVKGQLRRERIDANGKRVFSFCCLGVACEISGIGKWKGGNVYAVSGSSQSTTTLPFEVREWLGLSSHDGQHGKNSDTSLISDNDRRSLTFNSIANIIEKEPKGLVEE